MYECVHWVRADPAERGFLPRWKLREERELNVYIQLSHTARARCEQLRSRQWVRADGLWGGGNTTAQGPHLYPGKAQTAAKVPGPDAASAGLGC